MGKSGWKDKLAALEKELAEMDSGADSAAHKNIMAQLYMVLISPECLRYFNEIYKHSGAKNAYVAKEAEDYMSELWLEVYDRYDPAKSRLLNFLTSRMKNRIIDDERKSAGLVGLPRNWDERQNVAICSADSPAKNEAGDERAVDIINTGNAMRESAEETCGGGGDFLEDLVMDAQLYELASQIFNFMELHSKNKYLISRHEYYRLFYSSDIINFLKIKNDAGPFRHERDVLEAMHYEYTSFCTDEKDRLSYQKGLTMKAILKNRLAKNGDVLPEEKVTHENRSDRLHIPLQNEVVRGYLERQEGSRVSSSSISQAKKKYMLNMYESLRKKDLSYASIAMP